MLTQLIELQTIVFVPVPAEAPEQEPMPNADTIEDPERFVELAAKLLSIFPNGMNATQILDANPNNPYVSANDALTIIDVVPQLRKMLSNTPLERARRKARKHKRRALEAHVQSVFNRWFS